MGKLEGECALISGGGTGIGKEIALLFAVEGANIAICGRRMEKLQDTKKAVEALGRKCEAVSGDIGVEADVVRIVSHTVKCLGAVTILVNNASVVGQVAPLVETDLEEWNDAYRINITGTMLCMREALKYMIPARKGNIVNVSSITGRMGYKNRASYGSSKWAMNGLTQIAAKEVGELGIRVNAICPGPIMTERLEGSIVRQARARNMTAAELEKEWGEDCALKRLATAEECARVTLFLACDDSAGMTGQALNVTAGAFMS